MKKASSISAGFSLIELLIVIAIFGIIIAIVFVGVKKAQLKAHDTAVRRDVAQLRWLAEEAYSAQGASYRNWTQHNSIEEKVTLLLTDINKQTVTSNAATIQENQIKEFCISAPLRSDELQHYCVDATGVFKTASQACAAQDDNGLALRCPAS